MDSIFDRIKNKIEQFESGTIFFTSEFSDVASIVTIRKTLGRLCNAGFIRRIFDGIYEKPRYSEFLDEYLPTDPETAAYAIAKNYHWNIAPCGDIALNKLKLSTQVPVVWTYISDGPYREFKLTGATIAFKHRTNRDVSNMSTITITVIEALKTLGKSGVSEKTVATLKNVLSPEDKSVIMSDSVNASEWIVNTLREVCVA